MARVVLVLDQFAEVRIKVGGIDTDLGQPRVLLMGYSLRRADIFNVTRRAAIQKGSAVGRYGDWPDIKGPGERTVISRGRGQVEKQPFLVTRYSASGPRP